MDIQRGKGAARRRMMIRAALGTLALVVVVGITIGVKQLRPAVPSVEKATVVPDTVKRGPILRQVRGVGTLIPEQILFIPAQTDGRIVRINMRPGQIVEPNTIILELSNPELILDAVTAEYDLKVAEAALIDLRVTLQSQGFDKQSAAAKVRGDFTEARLKAERDAQLFKEGLVSSLDAKISASKAKELGTQNGLEEQRLQIIDESVKAQMESQRVKIAQLRALHQLKQEQVEQLRIRAGARGVLVQLGADALVAGQAAGKLEVGQRVAAGTVLAKIAQPEKLKAELKVTETEAKDIAVGQPASIDTRNGIIAGRVTRIDPAAVNGSVLVDVALLGALPQGARPDLSVDGVIDLERLTDVIYMGRPTSGQPNTTISLFKIDADGSGATRVRVRLGRASVSVVEVLDGLRPGDQVILSDITGMDSQNRIRLN